MYLLGILSTFTSSLSGFGLDEKVDKEKTGKEGSEKNGKVGTELNLKSHGVGGKDLDDGVKSKGRSGNGSNRKGGGGSLLEVESSRGDCVWNNKKTSTKKKGERGCVSKGCDVCVFLKRPNITPEDTTFSINNT